MRLDSRGGHRVSTPSRRALAAALAAACLFAALPLGSQVASADAIPAGRILRVRVADAFGGKTVIGQVAVANAKRSGHITAYPCADGVPTDADGNTTRADLNYFGDLAPIWSNRLVVEADDDGDICFYTLAAVDMVIDVNAVSFDTGITSFPNRRTDTRAGTPASLDAGDTLIINVPEAAGAKTVIGQLAVANADRPGHVTAYPCDDGLPTDADGNTTRADLNYFGDLAPIWSNRLVVQADSNGDVCLTTLTAVDLVVDINGVSDTGIFSFPNERIDTRTDATTHEAPSQPVINGVPVWQPYQTMPALDGIAALTGRTIPPAVAARPIVAVKIDNYLLARPQWGLERADAIIEVEVEGVSRFIALFHSKLPTALGPARSARTGDVDLLLAMNRPVFASSGSNPGVAAWLASAAASGLIVDFAAQANGCYLRRDDRPGPHNLELDTACAVDASPDAGPARPLWSIDAAWEPPLEFLGVPTPEFTVAMDGVTVGWTWDAEVDVYVRSQDGAVHLTESERPITAHTVVEVVTTYLPSAVDSRSPHAVTVGTGDAVVHRDGVAYAARWSRPTALDPYVFTDDATGAEIPVDVGRTFLEIVRTDAAQM